MSLVFGEEVLEISPYKSQHHCYAPLTNGNLNLFLLRIEIRVAFLSCTGDTLVSQQNSQRAIHISLQKQYPGRAQVFSARSQMSHRTNISPKAIPLPISWSTATAARVAFTAPQPTTEPSERSGLAFAAQDEGSRCQVTEKRRAQKGQSRVSWCEVKQ